MPNVFVVHIITEVGSYHCLRQVNEINYLIKQWTKKCKQYQ